VIQCGNKTGGEAKKRSSVGTVQEDEKPSPEETRSAVQSAFDRLKPAALAEAKKLHPLWNDRQLEQDCLRVGLALVLQKDPRNSVISGLCFEGHFESPSDAGGAILALCDTLHPDQKPRAASDDDNKEKKEDKKDEVKEATNRFPKLADYKFRIYDRWFEGAEAAIAAIIKSERSLPGATFGRELVEMTIKKMPQIDPPDETGEEIKTGTSAFKTAVLQAYDSMTEANHGEKGTGTQLGNTDASYGEWKSKKS
jgi:hypothetical protein